MAVDAGLGYVVCEDPDTRSGSTGKPVSLDLRCDESENMRKNDQTDTDMTSIYFLIIYCA
jgi:hypothetical protein